MTKKDNDSRKKSPGYGKDLAYIHHVGFDFHSKNVHAALFDLIDPKLDTGDTVVELGCGTGLLAPSILQHGYRYLGVDLSKEMLAIARRLNPSADFLQDSIYDYQFPKCKLVIAFGEIFNYCFDRTVTLAKLKTIFKRVYSALEPNGMFIFDCAGPGRGNFQLNRQRNFSHDDWAMMLATSEDTKHNVLTRDIQSFVKAGKTYRRSQEIHTLKLFEKNKLATALREIGFKVNIRNQLGPDAFPQGLFAVIASKSK